MIYKIFNKVFDLSKDEGKLDVEYFKDGGRLLVYSTPTHPLLEANLGHEAFIELENILFEFKLVEFSTFHGVKYPGEFQ